jgi:hypothetical protein
MYTGCCRNNHVHPYKLFWEGEGPYMMMTGDLNRLYRWSATDLWEENISRILLRFGFLICMVIGEQGCSQFW